MFAASMNRAWETVQYKIQDLHTRWFGKRVPGVVLEPAGLVALADLDTIAWRTALTGTATFLDAFVLCPGLHRQQRAPDLHGGELPATGAMTTGYVFRVENQATVAYLQSVGITGHLITLHVQRPPPKALLASLWSLLIDSDAGIVSELLYSSILLLTSLAVTVLVVLEDWWTLAVLSTFALARMLNTVVIKRRGTLGWKGVSEPGVEGDLLILLSQDRWIRLQGSVDALKTVTSGQWLRDATFFESCLQAIATLLVYLDVVLAMNNTQAGSMVMIFLLLGSVALLAMSNECRKVLHMHGHIIKVRGSPKAYKRRLDLAHELIKASGRDDWAVRLGMVNAKTAGQAIGHGAPAAVAQVFL